MVELCKTYNWNAFRVWFGFELIIVVQDPKDVEVILSSQKYIDKLKDYRFLHPWLGNGLITSTGSYWHRQRKLISPSFHFKILQDFHQTIIEGANRLSEKLDEISLKHDRKPIDVQGIIHLGTLDIICETSMGVKVKAMDNPDSELVGAFHDAGASLYNRIYSAWMRYDFFHRFTSDYRLHKNAMKVILSFNKEVIQKRRKLLNEIEAEATNVPADTSTNEGSGIEDVLKWGSRRPPKAFLDALLTAQVDGELLTDKQIGDEVSTFIFAGHDTTAAGISFITYHLSLYPLEQEKVLNEQKTIFGNDLNRDPTFQEIQEMRYLDLFIKESLRVITPVPFIGRQIFEPLQLNGLTAPAGANYAIFLHAMGNNPNVFENPEVFNPERFLVDARSNKNPYEYVPFSTGPRNCVGQKFAVLELKTVISKLVRTFKLSQPEVPFKPLLAATATIRSDTGIYVTLNKREL